MIYLKFLWSLLRHKWFVFVECCQLGIPWLGIIHDWSKFLPSEFFPYARRFYGKWAGDDERFLTALALHYKRNKHHWQYWLLQYGDSKVWCIQQHSEDSPMILAKANQQWLETFMPAWEGDDAIYTGAYRRLKDVIAALNLAPVALPMPDRYRREMLADWRGAGRAYGRQPEKNNDPNAAAWYLENRAKIILHPETLEWLEKELGL